MVGLELSAKAFEIDGKSIIIDDFAGSIPDFVEEAFARDNIASSERKTFKNLEF